ncbi:conjugal transfer protein TraN [Altericroceibacterium spongiae]|uniref:Conjugal transfer protein TraN n=2 Tax=Altericroceibacterium spongiae TaxID=2320269 RepID=A0A420EAS5_9SPHN|nr:conjugal transfer protein TraN [Altericroceibacterium spongiae]
MEWTVRNTRGQVVETVSTCGSINSNAACERRTTNTYVRENLTTGSTNYSSRLTGTRKNYRYDCTGQLRVVGERSSSRSYYVGWNQYNEPVSGTPSPLVAEASTQTRNGSELNEWLDESDCEDKLDGKTCDNYAQVCIDDTPSKNIGGVNVRRDCWAWQRTYLCDANFVNDCDELKAKPQCALDHSECLSENSDGSCNLYDHWYDCTIGEDTDGEDKGFVCSGDLYCLDGECTQVEREASTEFQDAMVAVQAMGQMRDDFDPDAMELFAGEALKCTKKIFGLSNCCSGKGIPLVTPFLCNSEDRLVDEKDDAGLCHYVGTYCSDKVLGVCVTKKQSYCCFASKLTRIIQEQGRDQLGLDWGEKKEPECNGFTPEQFQHLNLALMDFAEVYEEFTDAVSLPDEVETSLQIQNKIEQYYDVASGGN